MRRRRLTARRVAQDLGVTRDYVVKLVLSGELRARFLIDERDLDRFIESCSIRVT